MKGGCALITPEIVRKVADLAKLELTETEVSEFTKQLSQILDHFEELSKVDTKSIEPLVTPTPIDGGFRGDVVTKGLGAEALLSNAPERMGNLFKVPPVVG